MNRGFGEIDVLQNLLEPILPLFAIITLLGGVTGYFVVFSLLYWLGDRTPVIGDGLDRTLVAQVIALGLGALAITAIAKPVFGLPRPPDAQQPLAYSGPGIIKDLVAGSSTTSGYGFPSGHALGSTVIYGGLGWLLSRDGRRRAFYVGVALAVLVSLSRVVLGVHYGVDVLAGWILGFSWLVLAFSVAPTPRRSFPLVAGLAVLGLLVVGPTRYLVVNVGAALGGTVAWWTFGDGVPAGPATDRETILTIVLGLLIVAVPFVLLQRVDLGLVAILANAVILAALLAVPVGAHTLSRLVETAVR